jgi:hypothetical protein
MNSKVAFEDHFNLSQFEVPRYYWGTERLTAT